MASSKSKYKGPGAKRAVAELLKRRAQEEKFEQANTLVSMAMDDLTAAGICTGAALLTTYGKNTRQVRREAKKRLENSAKAFFVAVMAAEKVLR